MNVVQAMGNVAYTANGAVTHKSSGSAVLDLFSRLPAGRSSNERDLIDLFNKAYAEDPLLAMKVLFYTRDIRKGQGERKVFRTIWRYLEKNRSEVAALNIKNVPFYGRWDDLWDEGQSVSVQVLDLIRATLNAGEDALIYKWLPSENTSSKKTRATATSLRTQLGMTPRTYRKMLSEGRVKANLVETAMSRGKWDAIRYSAVPSQASRLYRKAFGKHDATRYGEYLQKALKGEEKINASVTFPYEIVREYLIKHSSYDATLEAIWKQLPDYVNGDFNALVMADVSGSMTSSTYLPLSVSISLATYFAERNTNPVFGGHFLTFSERPKLVKLEGDNLFKKIQNLSRAEWGMSTNIQAAFDMLLDAAIRSKATAEDMPKKIFIVSDMQFNSCVQGMTNYEAAKRKFNQAGYELPMVVFWNVNGTSDSPITMTDYGMLVAGCSPSILKNVLLSKVTTPYDMMLEVLNSERYSRVLA